MADFKDPVPHTGGVLTIHKQGNKYQLSYNHMNPNHMALVQLVAVDGKPSRSLPFGGLSLDDSSRRTSPEVLTMLPTDSEGMYGRRCPKCRSYFRSNSPFTEFCPYCDAKANDLEFFTEPQLDFIKRQHDAIVAAMNGPDGDTAVNFDDQVTEPTRPGTWVYAEEKQQTHFKCHCRTESDVLGEYVRCPGCGKRTARAVFARRFADLSADFEGDAQNIPKDQRGSRERRWRDHVVRSIAEFEALGRDVARALSQLPATPARRTDIRRQSFQNIIGAAERLKAWLGFDILVGISDDDRTFLRRMFNRRHLFAHLGGKVDQEYLDRTGDPEVRLNEVLHVHSVDVRRLLALTQKVATNLLDGFESIS